MFRGQVPTRDPNPDTPEFKTFMLWADHFRRLRVRANADTPHDAKVAREFGAEGIGLCRTEHMFFEGDRIDAVREMILAEDTAGRKRALDKLMPMQKGDFVGILRTMAGLPVTIRLLDPPLHEFLPHTEEEIVDLAAKSAVAEEWLVTDTAPGAAVPAIDPPDAVATSAGAIAKPLYLIISFTRSTMR